MFNQKTSRELKIEDTSVNIRFALRRRTRHPHETDDITKSIKLFAFCKQLQKQYYDYSHTTPFLFSFTFFPFVASVSFFFFLSLLIGVCIVRSDRTLTRPFCAIINTLHGPCMFYGYSVKSEPTKRRNKRQNKGRCSRRLHTKLVPASAKAVMS